jgi:hypothetical protein
MALGLTASAIGQENGDKLIVREDNTPIRLNSLVIAVRDRGDILTCREVQGDHVEVACKGKDGWIRKDAVMTLNQAIREISDDLSRSQNAEQYLLRGRVRYVSGDLDGALADYLSG